jgi:hypothetical protein
MKTKLEPPLCEGCGAIILESEDWGDGICMNCSIEHPKKLKPKEVTEK